MHCMGATPLYKVSVKNHKKRKKEKNREKENHKKVNRRRRKNHNIRKENYALYGRCATLQSIRQKS